MDEHLERLVTCRTIDGQKKEVRVGELSFRPSVYGVAIKDKKVLLVPCWDGYDLPGGGVHEGELILDAVKREVKEESGMEVMPKELLLLSEDFFIHPRSEKPFHSILMYYQCDVVGGELSSDGLTPWESSIANERKPEWISLEKIDSLKFYNPIDSPALIRKAAGL